MVVLEVSEEVAAVLEASPVLRVEASAEVSEALVVLED